MTKVTKEGIIGIYVAFFDRAPTDAGVDYWLNKSGLDSLELIAQSFFDQPETQKKYPNSEDNKAFIEAVYEHVLGRKPDQAGLNYWLKELESGNITKNVMVMAIESGAIGDDRVLLNNKIEIAKEYVESGLKDVNFSLSDVTTDEESVEQLREKITEMTQESKTDNSHTTNSHTTNTIEYKAVDNIDGHIDTIESTKEGAFIVYSEDATKVMVFANKEDTNNAILTENIVNNNADFYLSVSDTISKYYVKLVNSDNEISTLSEIVLGTNSNDTIDIKDIKNGIVMAFDGDDNINIDNSELELFVGDGKNVINITGNSYVFGHEDLSSDDTINIKEGSTLELNGYNTDGFLKEVETPFSSSYHTYNIDMTPINNNGTLFIRFAPGFSSDNDISLVKGSLGNDIYHGKYDYETNGGHDEIYLMGEKQSVYFNGDDNSSYDIKVAGGDNNISFVFNKDQFDKLNSLEADNTNEFSLYLDEEVFDNETFKLFDHNISNIKINSDVLLLDSNATNSFYSRLNIASSEGGDIIIQQPLDTGILNIEIDSAPGIVLLTDNVTSYITSLNINAFDGTNNDYSNTDFELGNNINTIYMKATEFFDPFHVNVPTDYDTEISINFFEGIDENHQSMMDFELPDNEHSQVFKLVTSDEDNIAGGEVMIHNFKNDNDLIILENGNYTASDNIEYVEEDINNGYNFGEYDLVEYIQDNIQIIYIDANKDGIYTNSDDFKIVNLTADSELIDASNVVLI